MGEPEKKEEMVEYTNEESEEKERVESMNKESQEKEVGKEIATEERDGKGEGKQNIRKDTKESAVEEPKEQEEGAPGQKPPLTPTSPRERVEPRFTSQAENDEEDTETDDGRKAK